MRHKNARAGIILCHGSPRMALQPVQCALSPSVTGTQLGIYNSDSSWVPKDGSVSMRHCCEVSASTGKLAWPLTLHNLFMFELLLVCLDLCIDLRQPCIWPSPQAPPHFLSLVAHDTLLLNGRCSVLVLTFFLVYPDLNSHLLGLLPPTMILLDAIHHLWWPDNHFCEAVLGHQLTLPSFGVKERQSLCISPLRAILLCLQHAHVCLPSSLSLFLSVYQLVLLGEIELEFKPMEFKPVCATFEIFQNLT